MSAYRGKPVVLGVDPGLKTGLSAWRLGEPPSVQEFPFQEAGDYVERIALQYGADLALVVESFTITVQTAKKTQAPWSLELIGVCRYLAGKFGCEMTLQAPSSAKLFSSDQRLRDAGWWVPGKGHGNDASRHVMLYAATRGWLPEGIAI